MTLNGVMALILRYFTEFGSFRGPLRKINRNFLRQNCNPKNVVFMANEPCVILNEHIRIPLDFAGGREER